MTCDSCGLGTDASLRVNQPDHSPDCLREVFGTCNCPMLAVIEPSLTEEVIEPEIKQLNFHGRKLSLCPSCYSKEFELMKASDAANHTYGGNVGDRIETKLEHWKKENLTITKWQDIFVTERPQWVVSNFQSIDEMKEAMFTFLCSMEAMKFELNVKTRAVFEAAKEVTARLSKSERDALINDPNFKPASNSEYKKRQKEQETNQAAKTIGIEGATAQQRKSIEKLLAMGMSVQDIKETLGLK